MTSATELETALANASEEELRYLAVLGCQQAVEQPHMTEHEALAWGRTMTMIAAEAERRKIEPLWRKARRFAVRNSDTLKEVGKVAAGVALGIFVGDTLID